ncbi:MAG: Transcriptional regulator, TrmB [Candidatus Taylorbacteria bacterium]|nr:Transcriptional regulator, TrmB [Candidatus Taylorbacteria bacterium]
MEKELLGHLIELGLTEKEARLYVWLVERIETTGYEASIALKIPRGTAYTLLEGLVRKEIVRAGTQNKKRVYTPESFSVWKKSLQEKMNIASSMLPLLESMVSVKGHSIDVRLYKGMSGVQKAWDEVIEHFEKNRVDTCFAVSHGSQIYAAMPRYFKRWIERRVANKTEAYLIYPLEDKNAVENGSIREPLAQYKFAQGEALAFSGDVTCGGKIAAIFSFDNKQEPHAVIIESEDISKIFTQWFRTLWHVLPGKNF